jgi:hypothetical protein
METDHIIVSDGESVCKIVLPGVTLLPATCRGLKLVSDTELHFSIKGECVQSVQRFDNIPVIFSCILQANKSCFP